MSKEIDFNLFLASYNGHLEKIKLYASLKGNINFALAGSVYGSHLQLVKYLLNNGATNASGCLPYAKDINIAHCLSKYSDSISVAKFIVNIFSTVVSSFYPFHDYNGHEKYEISIDNMPMRKYSKYLHEIINMSDEYKLAMYAHESVIRRGEFTIIMSIAKNIDIDPNIFTRDRAYFLEYVKLFEKVPKFITYAEKYLKNNHMSFQKIDELNEYSPISSCLARYYIKHSTEHILSSRKKNRFNKIYKKYIKYDPVFIILAASYNKENKLLNSIPTDIFRLINSYF
jgi:hypothetical protein